MSPINPKIEKFVFSYLASGDEVAAFKEAFKDSKNFVARNAKRDARALLLDKDVASRLAMASREALRMKRLDAKAVLERIAQIAFADVTSVAKVRRVNCRHCWGKGFKRMGTQGEHDEACMRAIVQAQVKGLNEYEEPPLPPGGLGFDGKRPPHPDCPECFGEGIAEVHLADFDKVSDDVKPLISNVKEGKYGIEVGFHSQTEALKILANCFGLMQPDVAVQIIQQMLPNQEKEVVTVENMAEAQERYQRLIDGSN